MDARRTIVDLKNNTSEITDVSEEVNVTLKDLKNTMEKIKKFNDDREEFNNEIRSNKEKLSDTEDEIEEKEFQYGKIDHPLIKKLELDIKDYTKKEINK